MFGLYFKSLSLCLRCDHRYIPLFTSAHCVVYLPHIPCLLAFWGLQTVISVEYRWDISTEWRQRTGMTSFPRPASPRDFSVFIVTRTRLGGNVTSVPGNSVIDVNVYIWSQTRRPKTTILFDTEVSELPDHTFRMLFITPLSQWERLSALRSNSDRWWSRLYRISSLIHP